MVQKSILVVEDEKRINETISEYFRKEGFEVFSAYDGKQALSIFNEKDIDLIILDIMLPHIDGWTLCKRFREKSGVLIIMLSALESEGDKMLGFKSGVDEYVTKPFSANVLVARAKALLQRFSGDANKNEESVFGIRIDYDSKSVYVKEDKIELTPKEYKLIEYLIKNKGIVLSREQIVNHIWGYSHYGDVRVVDTHVKNLRRKLRDKGELIKTSKGAGYILKED